MSDIQPGQIPSDDSQAVSPVEPVDEKRFRVVAIIAAVLYAPQVIAYATLPLLVVPTFERMFADMGGELPPLTAFIVAVGPWWGVLLAVIGILIFWLFYWLARKYWIGLLFAPLFTGGLIAGPIIYALYAPMFQVIQLVK